MRRWSWAEFLEVRQEVLAGWPTGREVDLEEAVAYHRTLSPEKNYVWRVQRAKARGETLTQPRGGVALIDEHIDLVRHLQDAGDCDLCCTTTDSYTRNEQFAEAERAIQESRRAGRSLLNGLPVVNHGLKEVRRLVEAVRRPLICLSGTARPRLTAEVALGAGFTAFLGACISYNMAYTKDYPLATAIRNYQYLDRLAAHYQERGCAIHREQPGFITGTLIPPGLGVAIAAIEAVLGAAQGLNHYSVGLTHNMALVQDVAALRALEAVTRSTLARFGFPSTFVTTASHQFMGAFPEDEGQAYGVIGLGAAIAVLGGATQIITKSAHEAHGIPTKAVNAAGLRATKQVIRMLRGQRLPIDGAVAEEQALIEEEAQAIIGRVADLGEGDLAVGIPRAFEAGVLDVPWSPSRFNANQAMPVRDALGAVRYLTPGNIPLPARVLAHNRARLDERAARTGRKPDYRLALEDVRAIAEPIGRVAPEDEAGSPAGPG
jgi:methylaspartate mutase epsilon subunit